MSPIQGAQSTLHLRHIVPNGSARSDDAPIELSRANLPGTDRISRSFTDRTLDVQRLREVRAMLRDGFPRGGEKVEPFFFKLHNDYEPAANPGLEGFIATERLIVERHGANASALLINDYARYVETVLKQFPCSSKTRDALSAIMQNQGIGILERYQAFMGTLRCFVKQRREEILHLDSPASLRQLRMYQVFVRAYNLQGKREAVGQSSGNLTGRFFADMSDQDMKWIADHGFSAIRLTGIYPYGQKFAKGVAGGSPYSTTKHSVSPEHGSKAEVAEFIKRAHKYGLRVVAEVVPNHTSCDSHLLKRDPRLFIHTRTKPDNMEGYFEVDHEAYGKIWVRHGGYRDLSNGKKCYWTDTAQLDFSNPDTRSVVVGEIIELVDNYGFDAIRIDSAYQLLQSYYKENWKGELAGNLPEEEFLDRLVVYLKRHFPELVIIGEAFDQWDRLSALSIDLLYGITDMQRSGGYIHRGWTEALKSKDPERIRKAIRWAEFLSWQHGGSDIVTFFGQHDFPAPWHHQDKNWVYAMALLTIMKPGAFSMVAGTEAKFEAPCKEDGKMITFNEPVLTDWSGLSSELGRFITDTLKLSQKIRDKFGEDLAYRHIKPNNPNEPWVGYVIYPRGQKGKEHVVVLANTSNYPIRITCTLPRSKEVFNYQLGPCGKGGVDVICLDEYCNLSEAA